VALIPACAGFLGGAIGTVHAWNQNKPGPATASGTAFAPDNSKHSPLWIATNLTKASLMDARKADAAQRGAYQLDHDTSFQAVLDDQVRAGVTTREMAAYVIKLNADLPADQKFHVVAYGTAANGVKFPIISNPQIDLAAGSTSPADLLRHLGLADAVKS
jgi:hypothetical protein